MFLVVAPTSREFAALVAAIEDLAPFALGRLEAAATPARDLVVAPGGLGKAQFAVHTQHAFEALEATPSLVICAGTSGALDRSLAVGDVVAGTHTVEHDFKAGVPPPEFAGHAATLDWLRSDEELRGHDFALHFGRIASGDEGSRMRSARMSCASSRRRWSWPGRGQAAHGRPRSPRRPTWSCGRSPTTPAPARSMTFAPTRRGRWATSRSSSNGCAHGSGSAPAAAAACV